MVDLNQASLQIIRAGQASSGAYVASPTFSQYGYSWLRDGTWIAYAMDCTGQHDSARAFYEWGARTLIGQQQRVEDLLTKLANGQTPDESDYLPTRFTLDGELEGESWWSNFQLDGYGTWLWGLVDHIERTAAHDLWHTSLPAVKLTIRYLSALWQSPNYDCWEEFRDKIHISTLASIYGGLRAVQRINPELVPPGLPEAIQAFVQQHAITSNRTLMKYLGNEAVDASLLWAAVPFRLIELSDPIFLNTLAKIEQDLHRLGGGVYRYRADTYYGGGEWILLTAWLGWVYQEMGRTDDALTLLRWIEMQATPNGELPEQVATHLLDNSRYAEWVERWGTIACPLLWSHAMVLVLKSCLGK